MTQQAKSKNSVVICIDRENQNRYIEEQQKDVLGEGIICKETFTDNGD